MNRSITLRRPALALAVAVLAGAGPSPARAVPVRPSACPAVADQSPGRWLEVPVTGQQGAHPATGQVRLYLPRGYAAGGNHPLIIALHGWNSPLHEWRTRSGIAAQADRIAAVVAVPDMGRTVYETVYFDGLRVSDPRGRTPQMPGTRWIGEVVLPYLQRCLAVSRDRTRTAIIGYSTGGRGAVLIAQHYPVFGLVAGFSGTYDLMALKPWTGEYKIHEAVYGPRSAFPDRWKGEQSVAPALVPKLGGATVLLTHGRLDRVVPASQTEAMGKAMVAAGLAPVVQIRPGVAHDWVFWKLEVKRAIEAFGKVLQAASP